MLNFKNILGCLYFALITNFAYAQEPPTYSVDEVLKVCDGLGEIHYHHINNTKFVLTENNYRAISGPFSYRTSYLKNNKLDKEKEQCDYFRTYKKEHPELKFWGGIIFN